MAPLTTSTFTIQPWTQAASNTNNLQDVLSRAQRGHLRDITEASLQEELATEGALDLSSASDSDDAGDARDADITPVKKTTPFGKPSTREDLYNAKRYMLDAVHAARNQVSISLDLMSLVVSKEMPRQAQTTLGAHVKERVPLGTLGVDFWQRMPVDAAREAQDQLLAANVKMDGLQSAADGLLGAAKRMEETVRRETRYWDQMLSVSGKGWNVCRVPGQQHRLGVRFGFSESAAQFSRKGIAALTPDRTGGMRLERGVGSRPCALRAVLRTGGRVVGVSKVPAVQDAGETTLEARIRLARDSLFDEELYHEIIRESRTLASLGVAIEGSTVRLHNVSPDAADEVEVELDLLSLDEDNSIPDASDEKDNLAQATILTARLLLSQAHRDRLRKRSEPPAPLSEKQKDERPILPILRPIMSLMLHRAALDQLAAYLTTASRTLSAAKIEHTVQQPRLPLPFTGEADGKTATATTADSLLTSTLLRPLTSSASLTISPPPSDPDTSTAHAQTLTFTLETSLAHAFGTVYTLHLPSPNAESTAKRDLHYNFTAFPPFAAATSSFLSSALANALLPLVQNQTHEWRVREHEAVLERDVGVGEVEESLEVDYVGGEGGGGEGELRMVFRGRGRKVFCWTAETGAEGGGEEEGFFDAVRACLT